VADLFCHEFHELTWSGIAATKRAKTVHVHEHVNVHDNVYVNVDVDVLVNVNVDGSCHARILSRRARILSLVVRKGGLAFEIASG
jgi:hypothetical protein